MEPTVLVTFATRYGSTAEVAQAVAEALRASGATVELQPLQNVRSLEAYGSVVLGAALYMGRLHKDARRFLSEHRSDLMHTPIALFVLGPCREDEKEWIGARQQLEKELAKFPWLSPVAKLIAGGRFDVSKLSWFHRLIPALRDMPVSDVRDWTAIEAWASGLTAALQPVPHA